MAQPARHRRTDCWWVKRKNCCHVICQHPIGKGLPFVSAHCREGRCRHWATTDLSKGGMALGAYLAQLYYGPELSPITYHPAPEPVGVPHA
ncbi:MAG TPA: hypothetical protein VMY35_04955 [Phycisphaerae bacterium]|nr:hypothetical protein [Phycisphaerae bacterium]